MPTPAIYYPTASVRPGPVTIRHIENVNPNWNTEEFDVTMGGDATAGFRGSHSAAPVATFDSNNLGTILAVFDVEGVAKCYSSGAIDLEWRKGQACGSRVAIASSAHLITRFQTSGFLALERISARQGGIAKGSFRVASAYDGTNAPMVGLASQAITGSGNSTDHYGLGPVSLNGSSLTGVQSFDWDSNLEYENEASDGSDWQDWISIRAVNPMITLRSRNTDLFRTYGGAGVAVTAGTFYLRKRSAGGGSVANGTSAHIKITTTSGRAYCRQISGADAGIELQIKLSNWTIATGEAIT